MMAAAVAVPYIKVGYDCVSYGSGGGGDGNGVVDRA